jgi:curli biogenesis system outer membrane secretion channel CsgG
VIVLVTVCGCSDSPAAPTSIQVDFRYEHALAVPTAGMQLQVTFFDCRFSPITYLGTTCPLTEDNPRVFRCHKQDFLRGLSYPTSWGAQPGQTNLIWVTILTPTNQFIANVAHDIYLNNMKVTRMNGSGTSNEQGLFSFDEQGHVY